MDRYIDFLTEQRIIDPAKLKEMEADIQKLLEKEKEEALASPLPSAEDTLKGVFKE